MKDKQRYNFTCAILSLRIEEGEIYLFCIQFCCMLTEKRKFSFWHVLVVAPKIHVICYPLWYAINGVEHKATQEYC